MVWCAAWHRDSHHQRDDEWFGAPRGIGILIINAMQNFQINLLWSAVLLAAMVSLFFFGLLTLLERAVYRWFR